MADFSRESLILPFDAPPPAALVVTDISYGDRDQALADQVDELAALARSGAVLPVPVMGRGTELALRLSRAGLTVALCPVLRAEMQALARDDSGQITDQTGAEIAGCLPALSCISDPADASPDQIIIAADTDRPGDLLPRLMADSDGGWRFIHTGHVAPNSRAETLLRAGRALRCSWNVHPRLRDHVWLAELTAARAMVPAFGALQAAPRLRAALDGLWSHDRVTEITEPPLK